MKYRIIGRDSVTFPYGVEIGLEEKILFWKFTQWKSIGSSGLAQTLKEAHMKLHNHRQEHCNDFVFPKPGKVLFEYNDSDLIVDKLKGIQ